MASPQLTLPSECKQCRAQAARLHRASQPHSPLKVQVQRTHFFYALAHAYCQQNIHAERIQGQARRKTAVLQTSLAHALFHSDRSRLTTPPQTQWCLRNLALCPVCNHPAYPIQ